MCEQVIQHLEEMQSLENGESVQVAVLRMLADISPFVTNYDKIEDTITALYRKLLDYLPGPPEDGDLEKYPKQEFSFVECLMYSFHKLAKLCPNFLTSDEERHKDLKLRLQYFARGLQGCIKKLNEKLAAEESLRKEKKPNEVLKMVNNINTLIKDLFRTPPIYKASITLSWKDEGTEKKVGKSQ